MKIPPLDDTRIHPEHEEYVRQIVYDALDFDPDSDENKALMEETEVGWP